MYFTVIQNTEMVHKSCIYVSAPVIEEPKHLPEPSQTEAEPSQNEAAGSDPSTEEKKSQLEEGGGWFSSWGVSNISNIVQKSVSHHLINLSSPFTD